MITLENISKTFVIKEQSRLPLYKDIFYTLTRKRNYQTVNALSNVNFQISRGEKVGIVGANGAGKTTLARVIAGIYRPTSGICYVKGRIATYLGGGGMTIPELNLEDNIKLYSAMLGMSRWSLEEAISPILEFAELAEYRFAPFSVLSSGMKQRLTFSVLAHSMEERRADIFIFDEALSAGDQYFAEKSTRILQALGSMKRTVLFISHQLDQVKSFCQKTIWLDDGEVKMFAETEKVLPLYEQSNKEKLT